MIKIELQEKAKEVMKRASREQRIIFKDMQSGDKRLFLTYLGSKPVTVSSIDKTLEVTVNSVEGDTSQLNPELEKYARKKGWLR